jgi:hypothetical protein
VAEAAQRLRDLGDARGCESSFAFAAPGASRRACEDRVTERVLAFAEDDVERVPRVAEIEETGNLALVAGIDRS